MNDTTTNLGSAAALLTDGQRARMRAKGRENAARIEDDGDTHDFWPVVKLFCPWGAATWLLSELDPEDEDIAFGLCDLGMGSPELGSVRLSELAAIRGPGGLTIERDQHFTPNKSLTAYADEARQHGFIRA
ncbi:DUF2958 domain-containing protein [Polymorphum gilvum]|uniref:Putative transposon protein n=1 Tax=Polymorphum gilvum (strain LMG 25793 / CGMCC 1.9160 / SL003B-26A1) TaxID=991905 RepID=F2IUQ4_POLGS|nr:DUF2958 domain-containing protein [Polymorphum gilvum]ADZ69108.1 Putative transposon protein [Polymorphum gilvum SL003B-26A1]